jgi:hypothetical protein
MIEHPLVAFHPALCTGCKIEVFLKRETKGAFESRPSLEHPIGTY